jgi:hypothetical protein
MWLPSDQFAHILVSPKSARVVEVGGASTTLNRNSVMVVGERKPCFKATGRAYLSLLVHQGIVLLNLNDREFTIAGSLQRLTRKAITARVLGCGIG